MPTPRSLVFNALNAGLALAAAPSINLHAGTVHGTVCNGIDTSVYRGIPYAQPPVGSLRFLPPQPMNTSFPNGALNASEFGPTCIQVPGEFAWSLPSSSEDCLTVTVYVPPGKHQGLPVKVWLHGGGDTGGSNSYPTYDLCHMATDSIAVAVQYRLGPLGFLALEKAGIEGNMGIKDQVAALEWVQANIASFGGDPRKVLLFGQSSGADDAYVISTLPQAKSLITGVICESGGGLDLSPRSTLESVGADYAASVNCSSSDLACMQSRSVDELIKSYGNLPVFSTGEGAFPIPALSGWSVADYPNSTNMATPIVDGKFITQQPIVVGPQVPIVLGSNSNDGSLFVVPELIFSGGPVSVDNYTEFLTQFGSLATAVAEKYPLSKFNSSGSTEVAVIEALTRIQTAFAYTCQAYRGLRSAQNSGVPAYAYSFAHVMSCPWFYADGQALTTLKEDVGFPQPMHTAELPLVFGNLNDQPWGNGTCNMSQVEHTLSAQMKAAWTAMAATGNPSIEGLSWTPFNECSTPGLLIENATTIQPLDFSECEFWDQIERDLGGLATTWPSAQSCAANGTAPANGTASSNSTRPLRSPSASPSSYTSGQTPQMHAALGFVSTGVLVALFFAM